MERNTSNDAIFVRSSENDVIVHAPVDLDATTVRKRHVATVYGLLHSTQYHFVVIAVNDLGEGARSLPSRAANTLSSTIPGAPYFISGDTTVSSDRVTLHWRLIDTGGLPCTFHLYLIDTADTSFVLNQVDFAGTTITLTGLLASRTYAIRLNATNSVGTGSTTEPISVTTTAMVVPHDTASQVQVSFWSCLFFSPILRFCFLIFLFFFFSTSFLFFSFSSDCEQQLRERCRDLGGTRYDRWECEHDVSAGS